MLKDTKE